LPTVNYDSQVLAVSGETGYAFYLRKQHDWALEPQVQVIYEHGREDGVTEQNGTHVEGGHGTGWISRFGMRLRRTWASDDGISHIQPYLTVNWWHDSTNSALVFNQVSLRDLHRENRREIKLGLDVQRGRSWNAWANAGWQFGNQSYHAFVGRVGVTYSW
jgi:outer membrane autotransporter protein